MVSGIPPAFHVTNTLETSPSGIFLGSTKWGTPVDKVSASAVHGTDPFELSGFIAEVFSSIVVQLAVWAVVVLVHREVVLVGER